MERLLWLTHLNEFNPIGSRSGESEGFRCHDVRIYIFKFESLDLGAHTPLLNLHLHQLDRLKSRLRLCCRVGGLDCHAKGLFLLSDNNLAPLLHCSKSIFYMLLQWQIEKI